VEEVRINYAGRVSLVRIAGSGFQVTDALAHFHQ
jgi:hypothetical protein